ncbi:TPA: PAS domain-containing protein [Candidatus Poribacteria bacterium]|nr:PAS domain-containing protein [Candidatus Poribacteria bacterium]
MDEMRKFGLILDSIADGVFTINTDWRIELFNRAAERITGFSAEEAIGMVCREVFRSNVCDYDCAIRRALETGEPVTNYEVIITRKDQVQIPVSVSASILMDDKGRIIGAVETFRDISQLKWLEMELQERYQFDQLIGKSPQMQEIFEQIGMLAENDVTVLIQGETGTGKGVIARAIHLNSHRADGPFVTVNCAALPEPLLESELFGHVKGAFTGAVADKPGRFELANGGTIFLDEIAEIPTHVQAKLLRAIEDKEFERIGGTETVKVDVRIIAATNRDLREEVKAGRFREDLFYRLNVISIKVPPLRERREDIPLLVRFFIDRFNGEFGKQIEGISQQAMDLILRYNWPGNVRELENAIEHAFVHCRGSLIMPEHLPPEIRRSDLFPGIAPFFNLRPGEKPLEAAQKAVIIKVLEETGWRIGEAADILGISRPTLWRKMKRYGIKREG